MGSSQLQNGLREERMQMIVVDDFSALDDAGVGACLGRSPSAGLCGTDRYKIAGFITGKSVSLGCGDAYLPVERLVCLLLAHIPILPPEEERQYQRQYEYQRLHGRQR